MASGNDSTELRIGEVLKRARSRLKLDIHTVEERTKIRTKYLRALENEEWDVLPGHPYAKGFLRTYAQCLGLDGDALVDEYRRTVESSLGPGAPLQFAEPVLERRRRLGEPRRRWPARLAVGAVAVALLVVGGLIVLGSSGNEHHRHSGASRHRHHHSGHSKGDPGPTNPVELSLITRSAMLVCLVPGHGRPLIDSQTLVAGSREGPFQPPAENYRLDLEKGGTLTLKLDGKPQRVHAGGPASYEIDANGVRETNFEGSNCR